MNTWLIIGAIISAIFISGSVSRVFGKYIDLKREKIGGSSASLAKQVETLTRSLHQLETENTKLQKKIEALESTVTSDAWDLSASSTSSKTLGRVNE